MHRTRSEDGSVSWIDANTGEDFTDRMNDPAALPGEGILGLARALGKLMAAQEIEAEQQIRSRTKP